MLIGWVSTSKSYVIAAVFTMMNTTGVANLAISMAMVLCACLLVRRSNWHSSFEKDPVTYFVIVPNFRENEAMQSKTLENLGRSPSEEKQVRIVLAIEGREGPSTQGRTEHLMEVRRHHFADKMATCRPLHEAGEAPGKINLTSSGPSDSFGRDTVCGISPARPQQRGHADTSWYPKFSSAATLESKRFNADSAAADPSDRPRHGDVRIGEPGDPTLRFSSRLLFVRREALYTSVLAMLTHPSILSSSVQSSRIR